MNRDVLRRSWRADACARRPELWLAAMAAVGMLLVEVGQSSRMAELCLSLDRTRTALVQAQASLEFLRATLDRRATRAEVDPLARELGLTPADARQVVHLPSAYLAADADRVGGERPTRLAWAERASRVLVPDAAARARD